MVAPDVIARALAWVRRAPVRPTPPAAVSLPAAAPPAPTVQVDGDELAIDVAAALCRRFEGLYLTPYLCPAGVASIGFGSTRYLDGRAVLLTDPPVTRALAELMLLQSIQRIYLPAVRRLCPGIDSPQRLAAIIDWCYNLGPGRLAGSTLRRRINTGRWGEVPAELRRWNRGGGRVLRGLVMRREAEAALVGRPPVN